MRSTTSLLMLAALLLAAGTLRANPVSDEVVREYRELPARIVAGATEAERARFVRLYGSYGFARGLLQFGDVAYIGEHFAELRDLLAACQAPPYRPDAEIQQCYRLWAGSGDLEIMQAALRRWLNEPVDQAPPEGGMIIESEPHVTYQILDARARAAEFLADDGDCVAVPLLEQLLQDPVVTTLGASEPDAVFTTQMRLQFALHRLQGSVPAPLIARDGIEAGKVCTILPTVVSATVKYRREEWDCPDELLGTLCARLVGRQGEYAANPMRSWKPTVLIGFANGGALAVTRPHEGWVEIAELGRDRDGRWRLPAEELEGVLVALDR